MKQVWNDNYRASIGASVPVMLAWLYGFAGKAVFLVVHSIPMQR